MNSMYSNKSNSLIIKFNMLILCIYIIWALTPYFNKYINLLIVIILGLWFFSAVCIEFLYKKLKLTKVIFILTLWLIYVIFLRIINFSTAAWGNYLVYVLHFIPIYFYTFYLKYTTNYQRKFIVKFSLIIIAMNIIDQIRLLIKYPDAIKELNFSSTYSYLNLGNTDYSIVIIIANLMFLYIFFNSKEKYKKIICLFLVCLCSIYPIMASKTTSFIITIIVVIAYIAIDKISKINKRTRIIIMILLGIMIFILPMMTNQVLEVLIKNIKNTHITSRLQSIYYFINNISLASQDSNLARLDLAALSFKSFLNSPLLGIGYHKVAIIKGDFSGVYQSGIGHHSAFFDNLAEYGIIGVYFYALIYYNIIRSSLNKCIGISDKNMFILCYIAYLLFAILNNITFPHIGIIMFLVIPLYIDILKNEKLQQEGI